MTSTKRFLLLLSCWAALASAADLATAHTVYVLSMSRGLDQYLANRLTNDHVFKVVTDPKLADVIFTDHLGEVFQTQLEKISPTPVPDDEEKDEDKADTPTSGTSMFTPPVNKLDSPGAPPPLAAVKAHSSWWMPSLAKCSGPYTIHPRPPMARSWIALLLTS